MKNKAILEAAPNPSELANRQAIGSDPINRKIIARLQEDGRIPIRRSHASWRSLKETCAIGSIK